MATTTENTYVGNGSTTLYSFTFPYIEVSDVYVSIDGIDQTITTEYSFANATTIEFVTAPADGTAVRIYRQTASEDLVSVFYPGSAIRAKDLNDNFVQNLYVTQEAVFGSDAATAAAQSAAASAAQASSDAGTATQSAAQAAADATAAEALANSASAEAGTALSTANEAKAESSEADLTANQALDAVLAVVPFETVSDVASIPSSPNNNEGVKITDSTGIESFSPLSGLPSGFVGDPGIFVDIVYNSSSSTWVYSSYNANDPDQRYSGGLGAVAKAGDVMTGQLGLPGGGGATEALQKQEVESLIASSSPASDLQSVTDAGNTTTNGAEFGGKVTSASTVSGDGGTTLTTKDYVDAAGGDLQSVTDAGNTTTNGATFAGTVSSKSYFTSDRDASGKSIFSGSVNGVESLNIIADGSIYAGNISGSGTAGPGNVNIQLNAANGTITAAGRVSSGTSTAPITGQGILSFCNTTTRNSGGVQVRNFGDGANFCGFNSAGSDTINLMADGSAKFAGKTQTGELDVITQTQSGGVIADPAGILTVGRPDVNQSLNAFQVYGGKTLNVGITGDGSATFAGTVTATVVPPSDARFKENITPAKPQLADTIALGKLLKNYDWNEDAPVNDVLRAQRQLGLIAQEAEEACPYITKTIPRTKQGEMLTPEITIPARMTPDGLIEERVIPATYEELDDSYKGISTDVLIMKLLGAVVELQEQIDTLKTTPNPIDKIKNELPITSSEIL